MSLCSLLFESFNFPFEIVRSDIVRVIVLAQGVFSVNVAKLKVLACPLNIVVDHVNKDRATEQALFLKDLVDQIKLVPDGLFLLLRELGLLSPLTAETNGLTSLDLEGGKDVLEAR